jgi:hypothetical protein
MSAMVDQERRLAMVKVDPKKVKVNPNQTIERLLRIAQDNGMTEKVLKEEILKCTGKAAFNAKNWQKYLQLISNWRFFHPAPRIPSPPCPICGASQGVDSSLAGLYKAHSPSMRGLRCNANKHHFFMMMEVDRLVKMKGITLEEAIQRVKETDARLQKYLQERESICTILGPCNVTSPSTSLQGVPIS